MNEKDGSMKSYAIRCIPHFSQINIGATKTIFNKLLAVLFRKILKGENRWQLIQ